MKKIFRFQLNHHDLDDSFYFTHPPNYNDCLNAIRNNASLAGSEYGFLYEAFEAMLKLIDFNNVRPNMTNNLAHVGSSYGDLGTYSFSSFWVTDNPIQN